MSSSGWCSQPRCCDGCGGRCRRYREEDEIRAFATAIDRPHTIELVDETGRQLRSTEESVIGFAVVHAR